MSEISEPDWQAIEVYAMSINLDCLPKNARGWERFKEQYQRIVDFCAGMPVNDPSFAGMKDRDVLKLRDDILLGGNFYKHSPVEFWNDVSVRYSVTSITSDGVMPVNLADKHAEFERLGLDFKKLSKAVTFFSNMRMGARYSNAIYPKNTAGDVIVEAGHKLNDMEWVGGNFKTRMSSLAGCPQMVEKDFDASESGLISLEGMPEWIGGSCDLSNNELTSLAHISKYIGGDLFISSNKLSNKLFRREDPSVRLMPEYIGGKVICYGNNGLSGFIVPGWKLLYAFKYSMSWPFDDVLANNHVLEADKEDHLKCYWGRLNLNLEEANQRKRDKLMVERIARIGFQFGNTYF